MKRTSAATSHFSSPPASTPVSTWKREEEEERGKPKVDCVANPLPLLPLFRQPSSRPPAVWKGGREPGRRRPPPHPRLLRRRGNGGCYILLRKEGGSGKRTEKRLPSSFFFHDPCGRFFPSFPLLLPPSHSLPLQCFPSPSFVVFSPSFFASQTSPPLHDPTLAVPSPETVPPSTPTYSLSSSQSSNVPFPFLSPHLSVSLSLSVFFFLIVAAAAR